MRACFSKKIQVPATTVERVRHAQHVRGYTLTAANLLEKLCLHIVPSRPPRPSTLRDTVVL